MPPDFLNSREDAILVWLAIGLGFVLVKDLRGIGASFIAVLRSLLHPKLLLLFGAALAYSAALVYAASHVGLWHTSALKATIYWYIGTAVVLAGRAVTEGAARSPDFLRRVLRGVVAWTLVVEFVVNVYAMPFAIELVGVLVVLTFASMEIVPRRDPSTPRLTVKAIEGVLIVVGLIYLSYFLVRVLSDVGGFLTREHAEDFLVPPALTLALIPFLYFAAWWSRRDLENLRKRLKAQRDEATRPLAQP